MKHLTNYLKNNNVFNNIDESLNNNIRMINESQLIIEHGKDIDNLLQKFGSYTYNSLYNPVNEASFNYKLTLDESITARDFFIFICEDYKEALLEELNIYEQYINDALEINEGFKNSKVYQNVVNVLKQGKDKTLQAYDNVKTKIKEVNQIIKDFANKTIKSVKEMANRLMELLEKFNCTIKQLFEKMGFNVKDEDIEAIGQDLAKNPEAIKGNDIYDFKSDTANESFESYGQQLITEDEESKNQEDTKDTSNTVKQADKKGVKQMLWSGFKQFLIWASVCVVIPGVVCAVFPGTFIALLVPLACKLAWNGYKIVKLWKQWQKVRKEWGTYKKLQKWITVIGMIASIIALAFNFNSLIGDGGKILSAFSKTGCDLLGKANLGIQPDVLTRGFAAFTKMISEGKFSFDDFSSSFKEITDSFAQHINYDKIVKTVEYAGKSVKEISDNLPSKPFNTSMKALNWLKEQGVDPSKVKPNGKYTVFLNGHSDASWFKAIEKAVGKIEHNDIVNGPLKKICTKAGSIVQAEFTGEQIQKLLKSGIDLGYQNQFSIIGGTFEKIATVSSEIVKAATSMLTTIPSVEYAFQNNGGFQVRLGTDKKKYVYEVGKDGVKKEKATDHVKELEKITNIIKETNNKNYKDLLEKLKEEDTDERKEIENKLETFKSNFKKINEKGEVIVFYGNKVENNEKNESLKSLHDYIINEDNDSPSDIFVKMFKGKELSKDDITKIKDYLDDKFSSLSEKDLEELISKINELSKKVNDEETTNENLINEAKSKTQKNHKLKNKILYNLNNIQKLIDELENDDNFLNSLIDNLDGSDISNDDIEEKENKYKELLNNTKEKYLKYVELDKHTNEYKLKVKYRDLSDAKRDKVNQEIHDIDVSFKNGLEEVFKIDKEKIKKEVEEIKKDEDKAKKIEILTKYQDECNKIFDEWEQWIKDNNIEDDILFNAKKLELKTDIQECIKYIKNDSKETIDEFQKIFDKGIEDFKKVFNDHKKQFEDNKKQKENENNLLEIYKIIISLLKKDQHFKDDVKNNQYELLPGINIEESLIISESSKLTKQDFKNALKNLKEYFLKKINKKEETSEDNNKDSNQKENDGEKPILMIAYNHVIDLSDSDSNGPRKDIFTLKGISDNYEFIEIKGGTSKENLSIMLGDILNKQTEYLRGFTILNPCDDKDNNRFKIIGDENTKRKEFGSLTNGEITDILNNPKSAKDYIFNGSSSIIQSEDDKKYEEDKKKEYNEKLKNADEETIKAVKEIDPDAVGEDGKIKPEKIEDISKKASSYKLAQHKSKSTKKGGGFWSKLKNFVKGLFGGNKKEGKRYNKLLKHIDTETNEGLNEYDNLDLFLEEMFKSKSLSEYIMERKL